MASRKKPPGARSKSAPKTRSPRMRPDQWHLAVDALRPLVVKISTPRGHGTGFLVAYATKAGLCGVATAAHVLDHEDWWGEPIRIFHPTSGSSVLLNKDLRVIYRNDTNDTAVVVMAASALPLPKSAVPLIPENFRVKTGIEVGWLGFPGIAPEDMCFFAGPIGCHIPRMDGYFVDGVAINGVSGGPAFHIPRGGNVPVIIGSVSAYLPNRQAVGVLPGLAIIRDVSEYRERVKALNSLEEAQEAVAAQKESPPPPTEGGDGQEKTRV